MSATHRSRWAASLLILHLLWACSVAGQTNEAHLSLLSFSTGSISPSFVSTSVAYTMVFSYLTSSISFTPTALNTLPTSVAISYTMVNVPSTVVASGSPSAAFALPVGSSTLVVISQSGTSTITYTIGIYRWSNDAYLSQLVCPVGTLLASGSGAPPGAFSSTWGQYDVSVPSTLTTWTCTPTSENNKATLSLSLRGGVYSAIASASAAPFPALVDGAQSYTIRVIAEDSAYQMIYTISVYRRSSACTLASLLPSVGSYVEPWSPTTGAYTMTVASTTALTSIRLTFTQAQATATFAWNGGSPTSVVSNTPTALQIINEGDNLFVILVTAEDGQQKTYTLSVHRISSNPFILSLATTPVASSFLPAFDSTTTFAHTLVLANLPGTLTIKATPTNGLATLSLSVPSVSGGAYVALPAGANSASISLTVGDTLVLLQCRAEDGITSRIYSLTLHRLSVDVSLGSMAGSITLVPAFTPSGVTYGMTAGFATTTMTIMAQPNTNLASWAYQINGALSVGGVNGGTTLALPLNVGTNILVVRCTSEDMLIHRDYTVTVYRTSNLAQLSSFLPTPGGTGLNPPFSPTTFDYTLTQASTTPSITFTTALAYAQATQAWSYQGGPAPALFASGASTGTIPLVDGDLVVRFDVVAEDAFTKQAYTVTVHRTSRNSQLSGLGSSITLVPPFAITTTSYTMTVSSAIISCVVTPSLLWPLASATVTFASLPSPTSLPIISGVPSATLPLNTGTNTITITVTSEDGFSTTPYVLTIYRVSNDATLSSLTPIPLGSGLSPAWDPSIRFYTLTQIYSETSVTFTPVSSSPTAHMWWTRNTVAPKTTVLSTVPSGPITLDVPTTTFELYITAEDGVATARYTVTITRLSQDSSIKALVTSLPLVFASNTLIYIVSVGTSVSTVSFTPTLNLPTSTLATNVNGGLFTSLASGTLRSHLINIGDNIVILQVTSQNTLAVSSYIFNVHRKSSDPTLASLVTIPPGSGLVPAFAPGVLLYTLTIPSATASLSLTATLAYPLASASVSRNSVLPGTVLVSGSPSSPLTMDIPSTSLRVQVTAEDGVTSLVYEITVHRQSTVTTLSSLLLSLPLAPVFNTNTFAYSIVVGFSASTVTLNGVPSSPFALLSYSMNGVPPSALPSSTVSPPQGLAVGANILVIVVTCEDPSALTQAYTVQIYRQSNLAQASAIILLPMGDGLLPPFASVTNTYAITIANTNSSVSLTSTLAYAMATQSVQVNGGTWTSLTNGATTPPLSMNVHDNTVLVRVISESTTVTTIYSIVVHRLGANALLSGLISTLTLAPIFLPSTFTYTLTIAASIISCTVTPTLQDAPYSKQYIKANSDAEFALASGVRSTAIQLMTGDNVVTIRVVSEDLLLTNSYVLNVHRLSADPTLSNLQCAPLGGGLVLVSPLVYSLQQPENVGPITCTPTLNYALATQRYTIAGMPLSAPLTSGMPTTPYNLPVADTTIMIQVTAEDGVARNSYSVLIHRLSKQADLADLMSTVDLAPAFTPGNTEYVMSVAFGVTVIELLPFAGYGLSSLQVVSNTLPLAAIAWGDSTGPIPLLPAQNVVTLIVTSEDGNVLTSYNLHVYRISNEPRLASLTLTPPGSGLTPTLFAPDTLAYTINFATTQVIVGVKATSMYSPVTFQYALGNSIFYSVGVIGGVLDVAAIPIAVGTITLYIKVTAEDGLNTRTSAITIHRLSADSSLATLDSTAGTMTPIFDPLTLLNTLTVPTRTTSALFTLKPSYAAASVGWSRGLPLGPFTLLSPFSLFFTTSNLPVGDSDIFAWINSEDTFQNTIYHVVVHRISNDSSLLAVTTSVPIAPLFSPLAPASTMYKGNVPALTGSVSVNLATTHSASTISARFKSAADGDYGAWSTASLTPVFLPALLVVAGDNYVQVRSFAEDAFTSTDYTFQLHRLSNDATLAGLLLIANSDQLSLMGTMVPPTFDPIASSYQATVAGVVSTLRLRVQFTSAYTITTLACANATSSTLITSMPSKTLGVSTWTIAIPLSVGRNLCTLTVLSEDGLSTNPTAVQLDRSPFTISDPPLSVVAQAAFRLVLATGFGMNVAPIPLVVTLTGSRGTQPVVATRTIARNGLSDFFQVISPSFGQAPLILTFVCVTNGGNYVAPPPITVGLKAGAWNVTGAPINWYEHQDVTLVLATKGLTIDIEVDATVTSSDGSNTTYHLTFPSGLDVAMPWTVRVDMPGATTLSFVVLNFIALGTIVVDVKARSVVSLIGFASPTNLVSINGRVALQLVSPSVPLLGANYTISLSTSAGILVPNTFSFATTDTMVDLSRSLNFVAPSTHQSLVRITATISGADSSHFVFPQVNLTIQDACDLSPCVHASACVITDDPARGFACVCETGWFDETCASRLYPDTPGSLSSLLASSVSGPVAVIVAPKVISFACDRLILDGTASYGLGPGRRSFAWTIQSVTDSVTGALVFDASAYGAVTSATPVFGGADSGAAYTMTYTPAFGSMVALSFAPLQSSSTWAITTATTPDWSVLTLSATSLRVGYTYVFGLVVGNPYGMSNMTTVQVAYAATGASFDPNSVAPFQVVIRRGLSGTDGSAQFDAQILPTSTCASAITDLDWRYLWTIVDANNGTAVTVPSSVRTDGGRLVLPGQFTSAYEVHVEVTASPHKTTTTFNGPAARHLSSSVNLAVTSSYSIRVDPPAVYPPQVRIVGASTRQVDATAVTLLDGSTSYRSSSGDASHLNFAWACWLGVQTLSSVSSAMPCPFQATLDLTVMVLQLPIGTLTAGASFTFELTVTDLDSGMSSSAVTVLEALLQPAGAPTLNILRAPIWLAPRDTLLLQGVAVPAGGSPTSDEDLIFTWSSLPALDLTSSPTTSTSVLDPTCTPNSPILVVRGGALVSGLQYLFTLLVCDLASGTSICSAASQLVSVMLPPSGGSCSVDRTAGTALSTIFSYSCVGMSDPLQLEPLTYMLTYEVACDSTDDASGTTCGEQALTYPSSRPSASVLLPASASSLNLYVHVANTKGATTRITLARQLTVIVDAQYHTSPALYATSLYSAILSPLIQSQSSLQALMVMGQVVLISRSVSISAGAISGANATLDLGFPLRQRVVNDLATVLAWNGTALSQYLRASPTQRPNASTLITALTSPADLDPLLVNSALGVLVLLAADVPVGVPTFVSQHRLISAALLSHVQRGVRLESATFFSLHGSLLLSYVRSTGLIRSEVWSSTFFTLATFGLVSELGEPSPSCSAWIDAQSRLQGVLQLRLLSVLPDANDAAAQASDLPYSAANAVSMHMRTSEFQSSQEVPSALVLNWTSSASSSVHFELTLDGTAGARWAGGDRVDLLSLAVGEQRVMQYSAVWIEWSSRSLLACASTSNLTSSSLEVLSSSIGDFQLLASNGTQLLSTDLAASSDTPPASFQTRLTIDNGSPELAAALTPVPPCDTHLASPFIVRPLECVMPTGSCVTTQPAPGSTSLTCTCSGSGILYASYTTDPSFQADQCAVGLGTASSAVALTFSVLVIFGACALVMRMIMIRRGTWKSSVTLASLRARLSLFSFQVCLLFFVGAVRLSLYLLAFLPGLLSSSISPSLLFILPFIATPLMRLMAGWEWCWMHEAHRQGEEVDDTLMEEPGDEQLPKTVRAHQSAASYEVRGDHALEASMSDIAPSASTPSPSTSKAASPVMVWSLMLVSGSCIISALSSLTVLLLFAMMASTSDAVAQVACFRGACLLEAITGLIWSLIGASGLLTSDPVDKWRNRWRLHAMPFLYGTVVAVSSALLIVQTAASILTDSPAASAAALNSISDSTTLTIWSLLELTSFLLVTSFVWESHLSQAWTAHSRFVSPSEAASSAAALAVAIRLQKEGSGSGAGVSHGARTFTTHQIRQLAAIVQLTVKTQGRKPPPPPVPTAGALPAAPLRRFLSRYLMPLAYGSDPESAASPDQTMLEQEEVPADTSTNPPGDEAGGGEVDDNSHVSALPLGPLTPVFELKKTVRAVYPLPKVSTLGGVSPGSILLGRSRPSLSMRLNSLRQQRGGSTDASALPRGGDERSTETTPVGSPSFVGALSPSGVVVGTSSPSHMLLGISAQAAHATPADPSPVVVTHSDPSSQALPHQVLDALYSPPMLLPRD